MLVRYAGIYRPAQDQKKERSGDVVGTCLRCLWNMSACTTTQMSQRVITNNILNLSNLMLLPKILLFAIIVNTSLPRMSYISAAKTVLITGCSRGIGAGLVKASLTEPSTFVIATCRCPETAIELQSIAKGYTEDRLLILSMDTTSLESYKNAVESLKSKGISSIDVLIANAGISNPGHPVDPVLTCSEKTMMDVFRTNCVGTMLTLQTFTPFLLKGSTKLCILLSSRLASIEQAEGVGVSAVFQRSSF